ncbi:CHAD domain-containing protein [Aerococcus sp. NPDC058936]|uniref:CHAD domain-containing protein n=1 Tax=Aerococcus sp. NPDC058936 TaxID=3346674 RepID=UPI00366D6B94
MNKRQAVFEQQINKVSALYLDYQNNPFSGELVHDLRVSIRELRSLLNFIKKRLDKDHYNKLNQQLGAAARVFGPLRELDVLYDYCENYAVGHPETSEAYYQLFNTFVKDRRIEMNRTFNKGNSATIQQAIEDAKEILELSLFEDKKDWKKYTLKRLKKIDKKLRYAYKTVDISDYEAVHEIRKSAKKVRYAATYFDETVSKDLNQYRKHAKAIQSEFGEITDAHVNYELLTEYADKVTDENVRDLLIQIRDDIEFGE